MKILFHTTFIITILFGVASCKKTSKPNDVNSFASLSMGNNNISSEAIIAKEKEKDSKFLFDVARVSLEDIKLGKLVQKYSTSAEVKELGEMMEDAHTQILNEIRALAKSKMIDMPTSLSERAQEDYISLSSKSGKDFNVEYCDMMVIGYKDTIAKFEKNYAESKDTDIKQWIIDTLPELRKHFNHSVACQRKSEKM